MVFLTDRFNSIIYTRNSAIYGYSIILNDGLQDQLEKTPRDKAT